MNRKIVLDKLYAEDLDKININTSDGIDIEAIKKGIREKLYTGESRLIKYKGNILAAMGYIELWPGICEVWLIPNEPIEYKGILALALKDALNRFVFSKYHRVQVAILKNCSSEKFFKKLGFRTEGILRKYSSTKQDYKMMARVI